MKKLKIVADSKIPFLKGILEPFAEMHYLSPEQITADAVRDADALIIRTRTHCNEALLEGSQVKMIATATIGYDHIDREYCARKGIVWKNAPGCNADSVGQYVLASLMLLSMQQGEPLQGKTIGLVGVGNVGKAVERVCRAAGMTVLRNDPPRALAEGPEGFCDLAILAREADFISFHTPLIRQGAHPTFHLADSAFFNSLKNRPVILNTSRGEVIDEIALLEAYDSDLIREMIIDCWEHEPNITPELLAKSYLSTPHIAGYSADGKSNATRMAVHNVADFFGLKVDDSAIQPPAAPNPQIDAASYPENTLAEIILRTYDPREDSARLRESPDTFEKQRGDYPLRREFKAFTVFNLTGEDQDIARMLGFRF